MALTETSYEHVLLGDQGVPLLAGTNMKVVELVREHLAYGGSAEEVHFQHPYLSLGRIDSALAYYRDHQEALDADIAHRLREVDRVQQRAGTSSLRTRLEAA